MHIAFQSSDGVDKYYSIMNPHRDSHKSRPQSQQESSQSRKSQETSGLFRPFDSNQVVNGYDRQSDKREQESASGTKRDSHTKLTDHHLLDKKFDSKDGESRNLTDRSANSHLLLNNQKKSEHGNSNITDLNLTSKGTNLPSSSSLSSPLNVPTYSMAYLQSTGRDKLVTSESMRLGPQESLSCVSKLDMEERRKSESRTDKPFCSDSECESGSEDNDQGRKLLISSGPPLKLDTSPKKIKLFSELGLTTFSHKKGIDSLHEIIL